MKYWLVTEEYEQEFDTKEELEKAIENELHNGLIPISSTHNTMYMESKDKYFK